MKPLHLIRAPDGSPQLNAVVPEGADVVATMTRFARGERVKSRNFIIQGYGVQGYLQRMEILYRGSSTLKLSTDSGFTDRDTLDILRCQDHDERWLREIYGTSLVPLRCPKIPQIGLIKFNEDL